MKPPKSKKPKHEHNFILAQTSKEADGYGTNWVECAYVICCDCGDVRKNKVWLDRKKK